MDIQGETAEAIATTLMEFLDNIGLDFKKGFGIGTDGSHGWTEKLSLNSPSQEER